MGNKFIGMDNLTETEAKYQEKQYHNRGKFAEMRTMKNQPKDAIYIRYKMIDVNIHSAKKVELSEIKKFDTFYTRRIKVETDHNEKYTITLFADNKEDLKL